MDYSLLIQERVSARAFRDKEVPADILGEITAYHENGCARLFPEIRTELVAAGKGARQKLEQAAGYHEFLIGAPQYLVLLSQDAEHAGINAGYIMEDLVLKLEEMGFGSCWLTFTDPEKIKEALEPDSDLKPAALIAFGWRERVRKKIHLNIFSMSDVSIQEKKRYFDPKKKLSELVSVDEYGNKKNLEERIGFYDDILWESLHAAAASPSYMNRQPYAFLIKDWCIYLLSEADAVTGSIDRDLNLGICMLHFASVAQTYVSHLHWEMAGGIREENVVLPEGVQAVAFCKI